MHSKRRFQWLMLAPVLILLTGLTVFPIVYTVINSFTDYYYLASEAKQYVGLSNYMKVVKDEVFQQAVWNTTKFMLLAVTIETILGLAIAVLVESMKRGVKILRVSILIPSLLPPVTVALIWQMMLSNHNGIINHMLSWFGFDPFNFLMDIRIAFYAILFIDIWQWTPFAFLLIYAALQAVPKSQYEAAKVDGANSMSIFRHITVPNIMPALLFVILLRTIDTFRLFDKVNILTGGGPANSTTTITQYIYRQGVYNLQIGYGSAAAIVMVGLVLVFSVFYIKRSIGGAQHDMRH
ncbi:carbohydrate ABC transporter permease [Paenibacillus radicis (ex Gao et al. 2016)]|uniref:Sugar ABC transporter permease n=1 Tax=Paenibacillus radicis (ex Gao et al. 2016) TaxID=1737354 RepID=A0A917HK36_9BACL|nr:sugar ABC transporter permease [Paenibacillus radicis (ex Gao et al. 2016)]GGG81935.1 sugar ABC transporter permease [Paenibacillus radicis (ex Gao et al. 2016)]